MIVYSIARKPQKGGVMVPVTIAHVSKEYGIFGDCRGTGGSTKKRQLTVISLEQWHEACDELGRSFNPHTRRANLCVSGHLFGPEDLGKHLVFLKGGLVLEITGETKPCDRMDQILHGLREALSKNWRGGVTCRVIHDGHVSMRQSMEIR